MAEQSDNRFQWVATASRDSIALQSTKPIKRLTGFNILQKYFFAQRHDRLSARQVTNLLLTGMNKDESTFNIKL